MSKKRSKISKMVTRSDEEVPLPTGDQRIGRVERLMGGDRLLVFLPGGEESLVRLPGKFRGQLLIRKNSYVLLGQTIEGSDDNLEMKYRYNTDEVEYLRSRGLIED